MAAHVAEKSVKSELTLSYMEIYCSYYMSGMCEDIYKSLIHETLVILFLLCSLYLVSG